MPAYDINSTITVATGITPTDGAAAGASTASASVDTRAKEGLTWVVSSGTITTGDFTANLEESDTGAFAGEETAVPAGEVLGSAVFAVTDDDTTKHIGSIGKLRHQRLVLAGANTPVGDFAVVAVQGWLRSE